MALLPNNEPIFAEGGLTEELTPEKYSQGWTGKPSDWAFAVYINQLFKQIDIRFNTFATSINGIIIKGIPSFNPLYEYKIDSIITHQNRVYRARTANSAILPSGDASSATTWEMIIGLDWATEQLDLKANLESPALSGTPTTPDPDGTNDKQIINYGKTIALLDDRICGMSVLDLSGKELTKSYPIIFCKNDLATDTHIYRDKGFYKSEQGNMNLMIRGIGEGENKKNASYLEVINLTDSSSSSINRFVVKIECREQNPYIVVWLRGGTKYYVNQRERDLKYEVVDTNKTLNNNWLVAVEEWSDSKTLPEGTWNFTKQTTMLLDYASMSDTGNTSLLGVVAMVAGTTAPTGSIVANGSAVSRSTYSKLFNYLGVRYGVGDGVNTFNLPDLRGYVPRFLDLGANRDCNQLVTKANQSTATGTIRATAEGVGSTQTDAIREISGAIRLRPNNGVSANGWGEWTNASGSLTNTANGNAAWVGTGEQNGNAGILTFTASRVVPTANEVIVKNFGVLPVIYFV